MQVCGVREREREREGGGIVNKSENRLVKGEEVQVLKVECRKKV